MSDASAAGHWSAVRASLDARPHNELTAAELDRLADALFWLDEPWTSAEIRRESYRRHVGNGDDHLAALAAWRLFYEHHLVGEAAVANGWVERCAKHVEAADQTPTAGWLEIARTDLAWVRGDPEAALAHARRARDQASRADDPDLLAMATQALGRAEIACHRTEEGMRLLDETMVSVVNEELDPHFTGWVFCNVISACMNLADLRRAAEWSDAALRWCSSLQEGRLYPGLCRLYAVELALLRGDWDEADADARRACEHLIAYDPRYAGQAFYLVGEVARLRGRHDEAMEAYDRAHELGHAGQPGRALLLATSGRRQEALVALRSALPDLSSALPRAQALVAMVELGVACASPDDATRAHRELVALAAHSRSEVLDRLLDGTAGLASIGLAGSGEAEHDPAQDLARLRKAAAALRSVGVPYEAARFHRAASRVAGDLGDPETAELEARAARRLYDGLGAIDDLRTVADAPAIERLESGLSDRELEVLVLVAGGATNRHIAEELHLSRHTVSRHLSNIFTKLGVHNRAAAASLAHERGLMAH